MLVFVGYGHHKLLDFLMNNLKLFEIGLIGLISENDANTARNMTLQLDTRLEATSTSLYFGSSGISEHYKCKYEYLAGLVVLLANTGDRF